MTTHIQQTLPFPWQGGRQCSLQLLIQPWICAPGTHYGWVDRGSVEYEVCPTLLHMASTENRNPRPSDFESNALSTGPHAPTIIILSPLISSKIYDQRYIKMVDNITHLLMSQIHTAHDIFDLLKGLYSSYFTLKFCSVVPICNRDIAHNVIS